MAYDGGYYLITEPLLHSGINKHSAALDRPFSDETLRAVNAIQSTPWRVNGWVLDLMREAWVNGDLIGDLPDFDPKPLPDRIPEDVWDGMSKEARAEWNKKRSDIYGDNARQVSSRTAFLSQLSIAETLRSEDVIWFPHFLDFRGRIYPMCADLHPQGNDIAKALLTFKDGKPLGATGVRWLAIRLANAFGLDKLPLADRVKWAWDHVDDICASARDPFGHRWWTNAEEPWQFIATCREWDMAVAMGEKITEFVSHLPVNVDGTANGLQHLSALGLDPVGARATNMTADPKRQDIYEEVAKVVRKLVSADALNGVDEAIWWTGRVTRTTVKRAVMTTPYGVTNRGIRDQLVKDGHVNEVDKRERGGYADYMRDKISIALNEAVTAAREIMAYIQGVAKALSEANFHLEWVTPCGNTIRQSYLQLSRREVRTLAGRITLWDESQEAGQSSKKNTLASAPNVVHSLDASALVLTVCRMMEIVDAPAFSMIHDSYGTHAADCETLNRVLREVFVEMYRGDWLAEFESYIRAYAPDVKLPPRPTRGSFNIEEVKRAEYFFA